MFFIHRMYCFLLGFLKTVWEKVKINNFPFDFHLFRKASTKMKSVYLFKFMDKKGHIPTVMAMTLVMGKWVKQEIKVNRGRYWYVNSCERFGFNTTSGSILCNVYQGLSSRSTNSLYWPQLPWAEVLWSSTYSPNQAKREIIFQF